MAANLISMYMNNPTSGGTDGTQISTDGAQTSPLSVTLDATNAESVIKKVALRCDTGYKTEGDTTISFNGTTADKWLIATDANYADAKAAAAATFATTLTIADSIGDTNKILWIKVSSATTEIPAKDISVTIHVANKIVKA